MALDNSGTSKDIFKRLRSATDGINVTSDGSADTRMDALESAVDALEATVDTETTGLTARVTALEITSLQWTETDPVNAVAASGILTSDNTEVSDGDTVTIGTTVYRFKDTPAQAYDVKRHGTTADTTMGNLIKAINASGTAGVEYYAGTLIHPTVSAGTLASHAFTVTAKTKGVAGNAIAKSTTAAHLDWDGVGAVLTGGVNGTVGVQGNAYVSATKISICTATNTIADANWIFFSKD